MSTREYDVIVLGGGIGGYTAAIRASQLGKKAAVVERDKLGGTCLHRGCIPSKALLRSAELYETMRDSVSYGIVAEHVRVDFQAVQQRKNKIVGQLYSGLQFLMKKHKIDVYTGNGRVIGPSIFSPRSGSLAVEAENEEESVTLVAPYTILATGSRPSALPGLEVDGKRIVTSDEALEMQELPASAVIIGGGVIGCEWASMLQDFGVKVTLVEAADRLLPAEDRDVSRELERLFKKRGIDVYTQSKLDIKSVENTGSAVELTVERKNEPVRLQADMMLVAVGRKANVDGLGLENTDVRVENGLIRVNEHYQTTESHIYAVGDCIGGYQLAHAAAHEAVAAVEHLAGVKKPAAVLGPAASALVPRCVYSRPETASVGWTEEEAVRHGHAVKVGKISFKALGKALVHGQNDGFVKVVADKDTNDLLGVHMIGPHVTDLIAEAGIAQLLDATPWEIGQFAHPHPSLSEALAEAMLAVDGQALGS
ncbi:dihydrolipoyl dehydrogenase [Xylanibacillus composti]|uniref:Dihydrolipoyl dehydrogenase n=1 Tax=Xylanibacillus composti TaxID=1572762 RepID=A0A8J4M222_9BACL|nr:dihydrolipoyl dehydrogenase [Xylanibacillus composti]MDT9726649.1 dihydrolipoyl dehydrogenase [Xylanibacillus composti]GIQ69420.1 dihydrolipoyl dehydrogenase [Xylanibacillus composti]